MAQEPLTLHPHPRTEVREELNRAYIDVLLAGVPPAKRVVNVHSLTGMGKTWLGYLLFAETRLTAGAMAVWVSFEHTDDKPLPDVEPASPLVQADSGALLTQLGGLPFFERLNLPALAKVADTMKGAFALHYRLSPATTADSPLLLFFDGLNNLVRKGPEEPGSVGSPWELIEKQVLERVVQQPNSVTFCFSHAPLEWNSLALRQAGRALDLAAMSDEEVRELLLIHGLYRQEYADFVSEVSQGHPWTVKYLLLDDPGLLNYPHAEPHTTAVEPMLSSKTIHALHRLPREYYELLLLIGVIRVAEVEPIEALLRAWRYSELHERPVTKQLIRGALAAYGDAGLFEPSSADNRTRFSRAMRAIIEGKMRRDDLYGALQLLEDYYASRITAAAQVPLDERFRALREWFYVQIKLVGVAQADASDLRPLIDDLRGRLAETLDRTRDFFGATFDLRLSARELTARAGILHDPEIETMLRALGLALDAESRLAPLAQQPAPRQRPLALDSRRYEPAVVDKVLPQILSPYGFRPEDLRPLSWIAEHKGSEHGVNVDVLREVYQHLGRPVPERSWLRSQLSRFMAANLLRYNYEKNTYYLTTWLRNILSRPTLREGDATGVKR